MISGSEHRQGAPHCDRSLAQLHQASRTSRGKAAWDAGFEDHRRNFLIAGLGVDERLAVQRLRGLRVALATNAAVDGIPGRPHREATELQVGRETWQVGNTLELHLAAQTRRLLSCLHCNKARFSLIQGAKCQRGACGGGLPRTSRSAGRGCLRLLEAANLAAKSPG